MASTIHTPDTRAGAGTHGSPRGEGAAAHAGRPQQEARLRRLATRLTDREALDGPAQALARTIPQVLGERTLVRRLLRGEPLGHPAHPLLTDVVIGAWTSAGVLDVAGDRTKGAATALIATGLLATPPTIAAGWSDWADTERENPVIRRMGIVHAATNATAALLYAASLLARRNGHAGRGRGLAYAGLSVLGVGGYLGSHLAFAEGSRAEKATG